MKTMAPNISGKYPLSGERVGIAWRAMWAQLSMASWTDGHPLAGEAARASGLEEKTAKNLLAAARRSGILEVSYRKAPGRSRRTAFYRVRTHPRPVS